MQQMQYATVKWSHGQMLQQFSFLASVLEIHASGPVGGCCLKNYETRDQRPESPSPTVAKGGPYLSK
jgi:hypothetical protein